VLLACLIAPVSIAEEIWVVGSIHCAVTALNRAEAASLFLGLGPNQHHLIPFDQDDRELREHFYAEVANLSLASVRAHWAKQVFTGRGRPPAILTLHDVRQTLHDTPDAITYIPAGRIPAGGIVLLTLESGKQE
jgi:hypothetical protein